MWRWRVLFLVGVGPLLLPAFGACGLDESGGGLFGSSAGDGATEAAGSGGTASTDGGNCFAGAKICPNEQGELVCLDSNDPKNGCKGATACAPCALPSATATCSPDGQCAIETCATGFADCNGNPVDGCEANLQADSGHCGDCATDCVAANGPGWICVAGACHVNECCPTGDPSCLALRDCDNDKTNGCEVDTSTDDKNCSACGSACQLANADDACKASACIIAQCKPGWADCDGNPANGCEISVGTDAGNCGACDYVCNSDNGVKACAGGKCQISCFAGFGDCDGNAGNGCEINLTTDPLNCKICKVKCNPTNVTQAKCDAGSCSYLACTPGFADCDASAANGCEINLLQDKDHCGNCATKCQAGPGGTAVCNNGTCAQDCGTLSNCAGVCVNLNSDVANCSACGNVCQAPPNGTPTCNGTCGFACSSGYDDCGQSSCFDIQSDADHCGPGCTDCLGPAAGMGSPTCANGTCDFTCAGSTPTKCSTGCYDSPNDPTHCGPTCKVCPAPTGGTGVATCVAGVCGISCSVPTPTLCGTECVDTQTDKNHCGDCNPCHPTATGCVSGQCTCASGKYCSDSAGCRQCCAPLTQDTCQSSFTCCTDFVCRDCCTPGGQGGAGNSCASSYTCCNDNVCHFSCN